MRKLTVCAVAPAVPALFTPAMHAAPARPLTQPNVANVSIIYEGPELPLAEGYLGAHYIKNLLGHFGLRGEQIRLADYRLGQIAHDHAAFYIGIHPCASTRLSDCYRFQSSGREPLPSHVACTQLVARRLYHSGRRGLQDVKRIREWLGVVLLARDVVAARSELLNTEDNW